MCSENKKQLSLDKKTILVTGSPGFIGAALVIKLLQTLNGSRIISLDIMSAYYDVSLKEHRLEQIENTARNSNCEHIFEMGSIADKSFLNGVFEQYRPSVVVNLAAQAGVRYSVDNPDIYIESNIIGFFNILEACRKSRAEGVLEHLVFASSSSIYGNSTNIPFKAEDKTDGPVSLYAATKKSDELLAHSYSVLYDIPTTGLRFFTVYGPFGRPDMLYFSAAEKLREGKTISVFNHGNCWRDFTYVDDVTKGVISVMGKAPVQPLFAVYNIGAGRPVNLKEFIITLHEELVAAGVLSQDLNLEEHLKYVGMQPGDVPLTYADTSLLERDFGYKPQTDIRTGLRHFAKWYAEYRNDADTIR